MVEFNGGVGNNRSLSLNKKNMNQQEILIDMGQYLPDVHKYHEFPIIMGEDNMSIHEGNRIDLQEYHNILRRVVSRELPFLGVKNVFFAVAVKKGNVELHLLPLNFNLNEHLALYPPHEYGFPAETRFRKDTAYHFLSLIASIPARNPDLIDEEGYTPITMGKLRNNIRDIISYKNYLLASGVIEETGRYIPGEKSNGYRWMGKYANQPFAAKKVPSRWADDIAKYDSSPDPEKYPYLFHWYQQGMLLIDPVAEKYALVIKERKMLDATKKSWDTNKDTGKKKDPVTQYLAAAYNIDKLRHRLYQAHIDNNIHRLHSVLTNLQKEYRNFITDDGANLGSVDIKNCQP